MNHDAKTENWSRATNRYPECACPPWRYNPRHPAPINPECKLHGLEPGAIFYAQEAS